MKRIFWLVITFTLLFTLGACSNGKTNEESRSSSSQSSDPNGSDPTPDGQSPSSQESTGNSQSSQGDSKALVVYFSWSGNTEKVANAIVEQTGADVFEIVPATPYSDDYDTVVDLAQVEQRENARPEISNPMDNLNDYDVIYVGYPNWWGDMPMILYTFFDSYDLTGKTIAPFCTSGGSGLSNTVNEIKELEPGATVVNGLHIGSSASSDPDQAVSNWLSENGLAKE